MIREHGLFTLLGSKPMTEFEMCESLPETFEDQKIDYRAYIECIEREKINVKIPSFEEYADQLKKHSHLNFGKLWKFWRAYQKGSIGEKYLIVGIQDPSGNEGMGLFVNIPNAVYVLTKYRDIFEKETGVSYDPNTIIEEIADRTSPFWTKAFDSSYLFGLLMGYGERNSSIWTWCNRYDKVPTIQFAFYGHPTTQEKVRTYENNHLKVSDLLLPTYASFSFYDETLETYRKEREAIFKYFEKKEFVPAVLEILKTSQGN